MRGTVTPAEAVAGAQCPKCGAPEGSPCTYMPFNAGPEGARWRTAQTAKYLRIGTPMPGVHPVRRQVIRTRGAVRAALRRQAELTRADRERQAVNRALRDFDLAEYRQMRAWLRVHGHLLRNADKTGARGA